MTTHSRRSIQRYDAACGFRRARRESERGIALLTVLALLTVFGLVLLGFTYSLRLEEQTVLNYTQTTQVTEAAEAGVQGGLSVLENNLNPRQGKYLLGKKQPQYVSRNDPALKTGLSGVLSNDTTFDARSARYNPLALPMARQRGGRGGSGSLPSASPLGIDEDPPGDTTGATGGRGGVAADGQPGFAGVDDNLDGAVDNSEANDDDEDGYVDEDPLNSRRDGMLFPQGTGFDEDGDATGVFDEAGKININFAGNNSSGEERYSYGEGVSPFELDLEVFLYGRMIDRADDMAAKIVNYRQGDVDGGGSNYAAPGETGEDDDGDNDILIKQVKPIEDVFQDLTTESDYPLHIVVGNGIDDDHDGLIDEEDENYIGASNFLAQGQPNNRIPSPAELSEQEILEFRLGDRIDNDGDGVIDEPDEGIDEPDEFNPDFPMGDDRPFATLDEITLLDNVGEISLTKIRHFATVYSEADQISPSLSTKDSDFLRLNPNLLSNWVARDTESYVSEFQYAPKLNVEDFYSLHVDNDGDWQAMGEGPGNGLNERGDGLMDAELGDGINAIDDDGDGFIDEPSDDWDGNGYPSADFDRYGESDVGAPYYLGNNQDDDRDGQTDEGDNQDEREGRSLRAVGESDQGRPRFETSSELLAGLVQEGNGADDDGDNLIDDTGDFNGDWMLTYDPEWHVNEDPHGDANGDGYPGVGAPADSKESTDEGDLVEDRRASTLRAKSANDRLTSFADDDGDGFADFRDPQVIAAMYRADADLVDNDNDGEVDEPGERYVAAWDDDEDGKMDEDPPEFQFILNLADYIDQPIPAPITGDPDVQQVLGLDERRLVLSDAPTVRIFERGITSSRQRALETHPQFLAGPNRQQDARLENEMELLLPNPPQTTNAVAYRGVEGIRINEIMAKPMIRLEAEDVLQHFRPGQTGVAIPKPGQFRVTDGLTDDGEFGIQAGTVYADTNWGAPDSIIFRPRGLRGTTLPIPPYSQVPGLYDSLAPSLVFAVTNSAEAPTLQDPQNQQNQGQPQTPEPETASWMFNNIPPGVYDVVLYLDPSDKLRGEVQYFINGVEVPMRSDFYFQDPSVEFGTDPDKLKPILPVGHGGTTGLALNRMAGYTAKLPPEYVRVLESGVRQQIAAAAANLAGGGGWQAVLAANPHFMLAQAYNNRFLLPNFQPAPAAGAQPQPGQQNMAAPSLLRLPYRLYPLDPTYRVAVNSGQLEVRIKANVPLTGHYTTTFDRIELINLSAQYLELVNLTPDNIDLSGYTLSTPYGKYVFQTVNGVKPIIPRIKPLFEEDDGREDALDNGIPLPGRPWDRAAYPRARGGLSGRDRDQEDRRLDNNFLLVVHDRRGFLQWAEANYPALPPGVPVLELPRVDDPLLDPSYNNDPAGPSYAERATFKLVDRENDILTDNYDKKTIRLIDPAGNEIDQMEYRTTFNNLVVDVPGNYIQLPPDPTNQGEGPLWEIRTLDVVALPGYRGMESFERSDPTQVVTEDRPDRDVMNKRFTPTFRLLARDAAVETFAVRPGQEESDPLTVTLYGNRKMTAQPGLVIPENPATELDDRRFTGGWDFVGDAPDPGATGQDPEGNPWGGPVRSPEFGTSDEFRWMAGGFENYMHAQDPLDFPVTNRPYPGDVVRYTWTMGLRELIRAGFDPDVDDQLTLRVRGKPQSNNTQLPQIVGEVLTKPLVEIVNPGNERKAGIYRDPQAIANPQNPFAFDVFTKLRDGDTAFTIDLRENFDDLYQDLLEGDGDEPLITINLIMRKTTPDLPVMYDNYFFYAVELCGRGRDDFRENQRMALIAGTPGAMNPGWVPAYPRRRRLIDSPNQRDEYDIVDNTPFIKNGLLATPGEISRIMTGNRFETINGPIIAQRLEEMTIYRGDFDSNAELARRMLPSDEGDLERLVLAQRERLDQYENQYSPLYSMVTTSDSAYSQGLVNVNTAIREVLAALPAAPRPRNDPSEIMDLKDRFDFNTLVADFIIEGRNPLGRDQQFGLAEVDDDLSEQGSEDDAIEFKLPSVGRSLESLKKFSSTAKRNNVPAIEDILKDETLGLQDVQERRVSNVDDIFASTVVSWPDDGPYEDISRLLSDIAHMKRRDRMATAVRRDLDRTNDGLRDGAGDLRERLNQRLGLNGEDALTPRDMEEMMNRLSAMVTVRSRVFSVLTGGKALAPDGNVAASRRFESVYRR